MSNEPTKAELDAAAAAHDQARDAGARSARAALAAGAASTTYSVQPGDTLESIAEAIYGDGDQDAHFLASAGAVISTDPRQPLPVGAVLTVPAVGPAGDAAADDDDDDDAPAPDPAAARDARRRELEAELNALNNQD